METERHQADVPKAKATHSNADRCNMFKDRADMQSMIRSMVGVLVFMVGRVFGMGWYTAVER